MDELGQYSPTILKCILSLVPQIFPYLEAFLSDTTFEWLNHRVSNLHGLGEKDKECSCEWFVNIDPDMTFIQN